jgi:hypothetical protein
MACREDLRSHWRALLAAQSQSGLSVAGWCREEGVPVKSFYYWRRKSSEPDQPQSCVGTAVPAHGWIAVAPESLEEGRPLTLRVGSVSIDVSNGFDRRLLSDVLGLLEARC